jgi:hypothetical protein
LFFTSPLSRSGTYGISSAIASFDAQIGADTRLGGTDALRRRDNFAKHPVFAESTDSPVSLKRHEALHTRGFLFSFSGEPEHLCLRGGETGTESEHSLCEADKNCRAEKLASSGLYSRREILCGTDSSNPPSLRQRVLSLRILRPKRRIARACGLICMMRGTGENHFPAVRARAAAKVSVGK